MNVSPTPLFQRKLIESFDNEKFLFDIKQVLNINTLYNWTWKKTYKWLNLQFEEEYIAYRFYVLKEWINQNESYTSYYVKNLEEFIFVLGLNDYLTTQEINYISHYKSIVFAKNRNIKNLIVDFSLLANEEVWYHYNLNLFYQKIGDTYLKLQEKSNIYLSNQRIIVTKGNEYHSIFVKDIKNVKLTNNMIEINTNYSEFLLLTSDVHTLYVSIERIGKLMKIKI